MGNPGRHFKLFFGAPKRGGILTRDRPATTVPARQLYTLNIRIMALASDSYLVLVVFLIAAVLFALGPLALAWLWRRRFSPAKPGPGKNAVYECGLESQGDAWVRFRSEYYLYAIVFLVFDVEAVFLLPFAVAFTGLPVGAAVAMLVFLLLLVEGLVWAWGKGVLTWR